MKGETFQLSVVVGKRKVFIYIEVKCKMDVNAVVQSFRPKLQPFIKEVLYSGNVGMYVL